MEQNKLQKLKSQLYSETPFFGESKRKQAALELKKDGDPLAIKILAQALINSDDLQVQNIALEAVRGINNNPGCINAVCGVWAESRHLELTKLLKLRGWVATAPIEVKVLTALKVPRLELLQEEGVEILEPLLQALDDTDEEIALWARNCAIALKNPETVAFLCQKWAEKRDPLLEEFVVTGGYIPTKPMAVRILTALKLGKLDILTDAGSEIIEPLLQADQDPDSVISQNAREALQKLKNPAAQEELCRLVLEKQDETAQKIAVAAGYTPDNPQAQALFYFLTEQWDKYVSSDPEQTFLEQAYFQADQTLREYIGEKAKQHGRLEWVQVVTGNSGDRLAQMTDREWETTIAILKTQKHWEQIWQLTRRGTALWSRRLLHQFKDVEWTPQEPEFERLVELAENCSWSLPAVGGVISCRSASLIGHSNWVNCLAISPDGKLLASGGGVNDKTVRLWDLPSGECRAILAGHNGGINCLGITPDGNLLVTGSVDGTLRLWQLPDGKPLKILSGHTHSVLCLALNRDGTLLATGSKDHTVRLWQLPDGKEIKTLEGHTGSVWCLAISLDGKLLASGGGNKDKTVRLWQLPTGEALATLEQHHDSLSCLAITSITTEAEKPVAATKTSRFLRKTKEKAAKVEQFLLSGSYDGTVGLWQLPEGTLLTTLEAHKDLVECLALSPDGKLLATGGWSLDKTVKLWQLPGGELKNTLVGHQDGILALGFTAEGQVLATGSRDGTLRLWLSSSGEELATIEGQGSAVKCIAISPDGQLLATGNLAKTVLLWTSKLSNLLCSPLERISSKDREWMEQVLGSSKITQHERNWLEFLQALTRIVNN